MSFGSSKNKKLKLFHKTGSFTTHDQSSTSKLSVCQTSSASSSSQHQTTPTYYVNQSPEPFVNLPNTPSRSYQSTPKAQLSQLTEPFQNKKIHHQASNFEYDNDQGKYKNDVLKILF